MCCQLQRVSIMLKLKGKKAGMNTLCVDHGYSVDVDIVTYSEQVGQYAESKKFKKGTSNEYRFPMTGNSKEGV